MKRFLPTLAGLALAGGLIAGCGGSSKSDGGDNGGKANTSATGNPATAGGGASVSMKNIQFVPASITVKAGDAIEWKNDDGFAHTVTATSGAKFDSGAVNAGGTFKFTPTKAGTIKYVCTIHPNQKGSITVAG